MEDLYRVLAQSEPPELTRYLTVPSDSARHIGTAAPVVARRFVTAGLGMAELALPEGTGLPAPIDFMGSFVSFEQYGDATIDRDEGARAVLAIAGTSSLLTHLALINTLASNGDRDSLSQLEDEYLRRLQPLLRARLHNVLRHTTGPGLQARLVARQPLLAAMKWLLTTEVVEDASGVQPAEIVGVTLSHVLAGNADPPDLDPESDEFGKEMMLHLMRIGLLYESDDMFASIDRTVRLWRRYGSQVRRFPGRASPEDLLTEATGLRLDEILAMGFGLMAHAMSWKPGAPPFVEADLGSDLPSETLEAFITLVGATQEQLRHQFATRRDEAFDFVPFQQHPILVAPEGLLVLDPGFLWERVTEGLYWIVHDHEREAAEGDRGRWTQTYAEAVELLVLDALKTLAPPTLGPLPTFRTEDDVGVAYGGQRCDAVIDRGATIVMCEVVSGQLTVPSRVAGDLDAFRRDTRRLVIDKCRQLDATGRSIAQDSGAALFGPRDTTTPEVLPVLVVGGGYPGDPLTATFVLELLEEEGLLSSFLPLCILDVPELEMLEGMVDNGVDPFEELKAWKRSGLRNVVFRNHVHQKFDQTHSFRPSRMKPLVDDVFSTMTDVLRLRTEEADLVD